jgi:hypothetical protein
MPKPTKDEMLRMAKSSQPRPATIRPVLENSPVVEQKSSVQLRIPQNSNGTAPSGIQAVQPPFKVELGFDLQATMKKIAAELNSGVIFPVLTFVGGVAVGWILLGQILFPVRVDNVEFDLLADGHQYALVQVAADLIAYDPNSPKVLQLSNRWPYLDDVACELAAVEADGAAQMRLQYLAYRLNGVGCQPAN